MNPDTLTLFREVANRSSAEREEYYVRNQVSDVLRVEVESLLEAGERTVDSFAGHLASAAVRALLEEPPPGTELTPKLVARTTLQPDVIGRYRVIRLLGRGGMSDVYLARDPMLERDIAVKLIAGEIDDDVARRRLVREASAVGRLRHANIVTIFDAGEHDGRPFIAMEYVPGETMRGFIHRREPLPLRRRLELIEDACAGLAHAHRLGVVHLDIKPDNLIVDESGVLKVLDFGIARVLNSEAMATRHIVGTLRYMSPEQIAGDPLDHRSDIFSLGCSLYELLAYLPAYAGSTREIVYRIAVGPVPRLADVMPDIDPGLDAAVGRAMALEPGDRYADLDEFRAELARLRAELDPAGDRVMEMPDPRLADQLATQAFPTPRKASGTVPSSVSEVAVPARRRRGVAIAAAAAVLAVSIGGIWFWQAGTPPERAADVALPAAAPVSPPPAVVPEPVPSPTVAVDVAGLTNEVRARMKLGDREGVLRRLKVAVADSGNPAAQRLPLEVLAEVRELAIRARGDANATPGATGSEPYRRGEETRASATRLEARDPIAALELLWRSTDLYTEAVNASRAAAAAVAATPEPGPGKEPAPVTPSSTANSTPPAALPPPSPQPIPTPAPAVIASGRPAAVPPPRPPSDEERVLEALDRYRAAFEALNAAQVTQVYTALNRDEVARLRSSLAATAAYDMDIQDARVVQLQGDQATVRAVVVRRITMKVGDRSVNESQTPTEFRLRRTGSGWEITGLTAGR